MIQLAQNSRTILAINDQLKSKSVRGWEILAQISFVLKKESRPTKKQHVRGLVAYPVTLLLAVSSFI